MGHKSEYAARPPHRNSFAANQRRKYKHTFLFVTLVILTILYLRNPMHDEFYDRTIAAMEKKPETPVSGINIKPNPHYPPSANEAILADSEAEAKKKAAAADPTGPREPIAFGAERDRWSVDKDDESDHSVPEGVAGGGHGNPEDGGLELGEVEAALNAILKRSPIIIFSKSTCPYSTMAKGILLKSWDIVPAPFVVELDRHPLGRELQAALAKFTGRATVPNVLVAGKSIGGGDDVESMHRAGTLRARIRELGGRRMVRVEERLKEEVQAEKVMAEAEAPIDWED